MKRKQPALLFILVCIFSILTFSAIAQNDSIKIYEGFYDHGWEQSYFMELQDNTLNRNRTCWFSRAANYQIPDSIYKAAARESIYLKIKGVKHTGGDYGHLGAARCEIVVTEILFADTALTVQKFFEEKH